MAYKNFDYVLAAKIEGLVFPAEAALKGIPKFKFLLPRPDFAWLRGAGIELKSWKDNLLYMQQDREKAGRFMELIGNAGYANPGHAIAAFHTHFETDRYGAITKVSDSVFWNYLGMLSEEPERGENSRGPVKHFRKDWVTIDDYIRGVHAWKTEQFWENEQTKRAVGGGR